MTFSTTIEGANQRRYLKKWNTFYLAFQQDFINYLQTFMEFTRNWVAELLGCQVLQVELTTGVWEFCFDLWSRQNRILFNNKETLRDLTIDTMCNKIINGIKMTNTDPFCGMDHQKSKFSLIYGIFSVGGCWGQPMLLFWKLVDETQIL